MADNYFEDLLGKTFEPMVDFGKEDKTVLDNLGSLANTAFNVLDIPSQMIGDGLDFAWDNTLGALTGTQDMFTGDDLKIVPEIASMFIPGVGAIRGAKALKNLSNVRKYEKVMDRPFKNARENIQNSVDGFLADYGVKTGAKRAAKRVKADTPYELVSATDALGPKRKYDKMYYLKPKSEGPRDEYMFSNATSDEALQRLRQRSYSSPVPLYRGGNDVDGWFYTPDRRMAKRYSQGKDGTALNYDMPKSLFEQVLGNILDTDASNGLIKLPKGTYAAPGIYKHASTHSLPYREVLVTPEEAVKKTRGKYEPKHRTDARRAYEDKYYNFAPSWYF